MEGKKPKLRINKTLFIAIILFSLLSLYVSEKRAYHPDEAFRELLSREPFTTAVTTDTHPPLYLWIHRLIPNITSQRYLNIVLAITGSLFLGLISINRRKNPLPTAILFLSTYQIINYTGWALNTLPAITLLCINLYAYEKKHSRTYLLSGFFMVGTNLLTGIAILATFIYDTIKNKQINRAIIATGLISSIWTYGILINANYTNWLHTPTIGTILFSILLASGSVIAIAVTLTGIATDKKRDWHLILQWLLPFVILGAITALWKPMYHDRYLVYTIPAFTILTSHYAQQPKKISTILIALLIIANLSLLPVLFQQSDWTEIREANMEIYGNVTVLHHSTFSYYPSQLYNPKATHYLTKIHNLPTPILRPETYDPEPIIYDYELQATNETPSTTYPCRKDYHGLTLYSRNCSKIMPMTNK